MKYSTNVEMEMGNRWAERVILLSILALFVLRAFSLFTTPVIDSYRWWGDESWLMTEFMTQMREGVFRHPYAFGASIQHSSGSLLGSMWVTAFLYGGAASIFHSIQPEIVHIGRIISFGLSGAVLLLTWRLLRRVGVSSTSSLVAIALLASSTAFFYMGHSARYDMLTTLAILAIVSLLASSSQQTTTWRSTFLIGVLLAAGVTISIHVVLLSALPVLASLTQKGMLKRPQLLLAFMMGCLAVAAMLLAAQAMTGNVSIFGSSETNTFVNNVREIPAMRLFSRSVQTANIVQKGKTMIELAPVVLVCTIGFGCLLLIGAVSNRRGQHPMLESTWLVLLSLLVMLSWVLFESAAPTSYVIYVLPFASIVCGIGLEMLFTKWPAHLPALVYGCLAMLLVYSAFRDYAEGGIGEAYSRANETAITGAVSAIHADESFQHDVSGHIVAFNPAIHQLLALPGTNPMTTHFIEFRASSASVHEVIVTSNAKYLLLYHSSLKPDYMREVGPLNNEAMVYGTKIFERIGPFTDIGRTYTTPHLEIGDTLDVYRLRP